MQKLKVKAWLFDIKMAIEDIETFLDGQRYDDLPILKAEIDALLNSKNYDDDHAD